MAGVFSRPDRRGGGAIGGSFLPAPCRAGESFGGDLAEGPGVATTGGGVGSETVR